MVDYTKSTGSSGTMMIRDTGSTVEFWLKASSATWAADLDYGWTVNGSTGTDQYNFLSGGSWQRLRSFSVSTDQTVTFRLFATGTSGLGGPTTFSHAIERSTIPSPPSAPRFANLLNTSVDVSFTDGSNGGDAIDSRQLGWSYGVVSSITSTLSSDGSTHFAGFAPGSTISVWARTHNSNGYSAWSPRSTVKFDDVPDAPGAVVLTNPSMTKVHAKFTGNYNGGDTVVEWRVGYGTSTAGPTYYAGGYDIDITTNLAPGVVNYFWSQGRNAYGWSDLSVRSSIKLPAGARLNVGGVWKDAVPYVRVGGIWKPAEPYIKDLGIWMKPL